MRLSSPACLAFLVSPALLVLGLAPAHADDPLPERAQAAAVERGAEGPVLFSKVGRLRAGDPELAELELPPRTCVVASLALNRGEAALELHGKEMMLSDADLGEVARLRYCAGSDEEKLEVRVGSDARARFALGVFAVERAAEPAPPVAAAEPAPPPAPEPSLEERLTALAAASLPGYAAMTAPREEDLEAGDPRRREIVLESGRCYRVLAAGESAVGAVALSLAGSRADRLVRKLPALDVVDSTVRVARSDLVCAEHTGPYALEVHILGTGRVVWQLFGAADPESAWRWQAGGEEQGPVARQVRTERDRRVPGQHGLTPFARRNLRTSQHVETTFEVVAGHCYLAIGAGVPSLRAVELELYDQRNSPVVRVSAAGEPAVARACAVVNGRWRARLRAFKGYGEAGVQVFAAP